MAIKDQRTLPQSVEPPKPSKARRPCLRLIDLTPNTYVDTIVRVERVKPIGEAKTRLDAQRLFLHDIKEKLLGKNVKATGSVVQASDRIYFFPRMISGVSQWSWTN